MRGRVHGTVIVLLVAMLCPLAAPLLAGIGAGSGAMACCRSRGACCCRKTPAHGGSGFTTKTCPCQSVRSTTPLTRTAFLAHRIGGAVLCASAPALDPADLAAHRATLACSQFQRPPPRG